MLEPVLLMCVYWVLIGMILGRGGLEFPLFVLCGLLPFRAVVGSLGQSVNSIASKYSIISQIPFPTIYLPLSDVLSNYFKLIFGLIIVVLFAINYGHYPGLHTFYLIIPYTLQCLMSVGIALLVCIIGVYVPDIRNMMQVITRIWMYASPVLYETARLPGVWREYMLVNPMASIILMYRQIIIDGAAPSMTYLSIAFAEMVFFVILGWVVFMTCHTRILKLL